MLNGQEPATHGKSLKTLQAEIEKKSGKTPEQLYEEREKRIREAIELKEPDRVPFWITHDPCRFYNVQQSAAYYEPVIWKEAMIQTTLDFEGDLGMGGFGSSGLSWEALEVKNKLWPGGPLPPDYEYQFVEGEYMKEDEYDLFLSDPSDFVIRYYLPRVYGALLPLNTLPPVSLMFNRLEGITPLFDSPEFKKMARAISKAGRELKKYRKAAGNVNEELELLGFPPFSHWGGAGGAPFDTVSSFLRGMKGSMIDMYRRPEKLLQLCDKVLDQQIAAALPADPAKRGNPKRVGVPLWRGDKTFMSEKQFQKFYWPGLKKALLTTISLGFVPIIFFEDCFGERLECLKELPKGKVVAVVEHMDVVPAKAMLAGHTCIMGKVPSSLRYSSITEMVDYYKNMIDAAGKGGGFMMNIIFPDKATKEELQTMVQTIKEYSRY
jgi:uroporphyrinogen-III decarboxylase